MGKWGPLAAVVAILGGLYLTNPDERQFVEWNSDRLSDKLPVPKADANGWEAMGSAMAIAAMPGIIRSYNRREDYGLFSLYWGKGPWDGALVLGIGGKFLGLENSHAS